MCVQGLVPERRHARLRRGLSLNGIHWTFGIEEGVAGTVVALGAPPENRHKAYEDSHND